MSPTRSVWLALAALLLAVASVMAAAALLLVQAQTANRERSALIRFVCTAIEIQEQGDSPLAAEYRRRFTLILADLGEHPCAQKHAAP